MPQKTGPLEQDNQRLADAVYERLGEAIIDGTLEPGARIRDQEIAADFGVSRMPVREALQRLERIGMVEMSASRFTRITEVTDADIADTVEYLGYQAAAATRMAVPRMNESQRERAVLLANAVVEQLSSVDADEPDTLQPLFQALNSLWAHLAVSSGNMVFSRALSEAWFALERAFRGRRLLGKSLEVMREDFVALAAAIEAGDADEAERIVRFEYDISER